MVVLNVKKQLAETNGSVNEGFQDTFGRNDDKRVHCVDNKMDMDKTLKNDNTIDITNTNIGDNCYVNNLDNTACSRPEKNKKLGILTNEKTGHHAEAILVNDAVASYGRGSAKKVVVDELNMAVGAGETFALLGPSGCGKTTLLSCALGRKSLDSGTIQVLGGRPGDRRMGLPGAAVGYMPQDICLYGEFSIKETLGYFGRIYGMSGGQVEERMEVLTGLLELPGKDRRVWSLSGGQKRRVSLCVALLHAPPLLILDEPTVGLDPLVRRNIWDHLTGLAMSGVTVVITTHYIEEARGADTAAIMRDGRLLVQENPEVLLNQFGCTTLEGVFLGLCSFDTTEQNKLRKIISKATFGQNMPAKENGIFAVSYKRTEISRGKHNYNHDMYENCKGENWSSVPSINNLTALLIKNLTRMVRNVPMLLFIFLLPAIFIVFFCTAVGRDPQHLRLAVSYQGHHQCSSSPDSSCTLDSSSMACTFLSFLNSSSNISPVFFSNKSLAVEEVRAGNAWGAVHIPDSFGDAIKVSLDMSNQQIGFVVQKSLGRALQDTINHVKEACQINQISDKANLLHYEDPIFGTVDPTFTEFLAPGIVVLIIYFLAMSLTGEAFIIERSQGLLERSWIAGVRPVEILASYIISQFLVMIIQTAVTLLTIIFIFSIPCRGSVFALIFLTILQGLAGMSFGFFISTISDDILIAMKLAIGSFFPNLLLSGIIWPVEGMPVLLQEVVWFLPSTATVQAMRDVMGRGWHLGMSSVYTGAIISSTWIIVFLIISWIMVKIKL